MYFNIVDWMEESEAQDYIASVLSPSCGAKRLLSSESEGSSPVTQPSKKFQSNKMAGESDISSTLNKFIEEYKKGHEITTRECQ